MKRTRRFKLCEGCGYPMPLDEPGLCDPCRDRVREENRVLLDTSSGPIPAPVWADVVRAIGKPVRRK